MDYRVIRSSRKTISLQITPEGEILVRCPNRMKIGDIDVFVKNHESWIQRHMPRQNFPRLTGQELDTLAKEAAKKIPVIVRKYAAILGVSYGRITIRCQRTRWGSCSAKGNLNFNCLLMLMPETVQEYVVVHELCHRKEMNHGADFWTLVETVLPDYCTRRRWLKENGTAIISRIP